MQVPKQFIRWLAAAFPAPGTSTIVTLQWLRLLAASYVVLSHVGDRMAEMQARFAIDGGQVKFDGGFGVRIFFAISGFIMIYVAGEKFGSRGYSLHFIRNRFLRIAPLYWVLTLTNAALIFISGSYKVEPGRIGLTAIAKSLMFIPYLSWSGSHRPVLEAGWTLDFEMLFYVLFAICLIFPKRLGLGLLIGALLLIGLGRGPLIEPLRIWADEIVLYFLIGIVFALIRKSVLARQPLPAFPVRPALAALGAVAGYCLVENMGYPLLPPAIWELIFVVATMVFAVLFQDEAKGTAFSRFAIAGGDASYSLYLAHGFALLFVGIAWRKVFGGSFMAAYYWLTFGICLASGLACYVFLERPLTAMTARLIGRRPGNVPSPHG
jgi:exopolysaccharide production protein ExoZ